MTTTRSQDFQQAFRNLQLQPLITPEEREKFYVPYGEEMLPELEQIITDCTDRNNQLVFAGHRGCGKSTLLSEFSRSVSHRYFSVFFSISDLIEAPAVDHIQILFAIALQLMEKATTEEVPISADKKQAIFKWFQERTRTETETIGAEGEVGFDFFGIIKGKLKSDGTVREEIKTTFQKNFRDLTNRINTIAAEIKLTAQKEILVIIDDIDKLDLRQIKEIFYENIKALLDPNFIVIYTIPVATIRDGVLKKHIEDETQNQIYVLPVTKLYHKGNRDKPIPENYKLLTEILCKRTVAPELFAEGIIDQIVLYSGGVLRELIRITQECCRLVRVDILAKERRQEAVGNIQVDDEILQTALQNIRSSMDITLSKTDRQILQTTYNNFKPDDPKEQAFLDLLHNTAVIEYRNGNSWYDVFPLIVEQLREEKLIP